MERRAALKSPCDRQAKHAEEHQADSHASREKHCEPADITIIRLRILAAKPDLVPGTDNQKQAENGENIGGPNEEPVKCQC